MYKYLSFSIIIIVFLSLSACKSDAKMPQLDLMSYGLPISIAAPTDAVVTMDDLGIWKDVTVKSGDNYFIQLICSKANTLDAAKVKSQKMTDVKYEPFFSKIIQEDEHGFIFEKQIDENTIDYDFRHILIQGDLEYIFQTGLYGTFSEEEVRNMYKSVIN